MEFLTTRELRLSPKEVWKRLRKARVGIVTLNGKPRFVLSSIEPDELEEVLYLMNRIRAERAVQGMTRTAREKGLEHLSMDEIDEVIKKSKRK